MSRRKQLPLDFRGRHRRKKIWKKPGPKRYSRNVSHTTRRMFQKTRPLHVTVRMERSVWTLRTHRMHRSIREVFFKITDEREKFRLCHYSIQRNHLHLVVEARDRAAMTRGMRRIGIRLALKLNKSMGRPRGRVLSDRYDEKHLETPSQVRNAIGYVLNNFRKHHFHETRRMLDPRWIDPFSSGAFFDGWRHGPPPRSSYGLIVRPRTWLLQEGWRRRGQLAVGFIPGGGKS